MYTFMLHACLKGFPKDRAHKINKFEIVFHLLSIFCSTATQSLNKKVTQEFSCSPKHPINGPHDRESPICRPSSE